MPTLRRWRDGVKSPAPPSAAKRRRRRRSPEDPAIGSYRNPASRIPMKPLPFRPFERPAATVPSLRSVAWRPHAANLDSRLRGNCGHSEAADPGSPNRRIRVAVSSSWLIGCIAIFRPSGLTLSLVQAMTAFADTRALCEPDHIDHKILVALMRAILRQGRRVGGRPMRIPSSIRSIKYESNISPKNTKYAMPYHGVYGESST